MSKETYKDRILEFLSNGPPHSKMTAEAVANILGCSSSWVYEVGSEAGYKFAHDTVKDSLWTDADYRYQQEKDQLFKTEITRINRGNSNATEWNIHGDGDSVTVFASEDGIQMVWHAEGSGVRDAIWWRWEEVFNNIFGFEALEGYAAEGTANPEMQMLRSIQDGSVDKKYIQSSWPSSSWTGLQPAWDSISFVESPHDSDQYTVYSVKLPKQAAFNGKAREALSELRRKRIHPSHDSRDYGKFQVIVANMVSPSKNGVAEVRPNGTEGPITIPTVIFTWIDECPDSLDNAELTDKASMEIALTIDDLVDLIDEHGEAI